jgi:chemotaxis protein histidine kinase CheA
MDWLPCAFETPASAWDEVARLAPSRVTREKDGARSWLELAWSPVLKDGAVDRVMLLVTDVTRARQIEQDAELREEQHAREMRVMRRLVAGGGQVFATFLGSAKQRLGDARTVLDAPSGPASWNELLMSVHTLRGEARTFELIELALACEAIERAVRQARDDAAVVDEAWKRGILAATATAESLLEHARELFVAASPIGAAVFDQMTVRRSDVRALEATADRAGEETRRLIVALVSRPFGECVTGLEAAATRWAAENEKRVRLRVEGQDARIPGAVASAVTAALPHLVRNAIAHGIEAPSRRRASLKDEVGTIAITATAEPFLVRVADDGKGLDTDAIRERARALGIPGDRPSLLAFAEGLSTAPQTTEIAGHGVGLAAVVHALAAVGCKVELRSNAGDGTEVSISLRDGT